MKVGQKVIMRVATAHGERKFDPPLTHHHWITIEISKDASTPLLEIELPLDEFGRLIAQRDANGWIEYAKERS